MKRTKTLIVGIVSGIICVVSVFLYTQDVHAEAEAARAEALSRYGGEQLEVCVATRDIGLGESVDTSNTTTKLWVADLLPEGAARSVTEIIGKQAASPILSGEVISVKRFEDGTPAIEIPEGLTVLSVPAKEVQTIGGLLSGGMRVDIYATGVDTTLLARSVLVVGTNLDSSDSKSNASLSWVTLALEQQSVEEIIAASQKMELYFVLPSSNKEGVSS